MLPFTVSIAHNEDAYLAGAEAVRLLGGMEGIVVPGETAFALNCGGPTARPGDESPGHQ